MGIGIIIIIIVILIFNPIYMNAETQDTSNVDHQLYFKTQYAGNLGIVSVGFGKAFLKKKTTIDLNYGYLPKFINGSKVQTIALKATYHLIRKPICTIGTDLYLGSALAYSSACNTYSKYPDYYPEGYYQNNALHLNPYIGLLFYNPVKKKKKEFIEFYVELGTVDTQIGHAFLNETISFFDIWNLGFGIVIPY